jgi:hypothetical protein
LYSPGTVGLVSAGIKYWVVLRKASWDFTGLILP